MKAICIADIHLSGFSQDKIIDNLPERLHEKKKVLNNISQYAIDSGIKTIIIAGDILHNKSIIYTIAQDFLIDYIRESALKGLKFIIIDGNHDLSGKGKIVSSALKSLDNFENVTMIHYDKILKIDNVLFVPYSIDLPEIIKSNKSKYLISHFGLNEAQLNSGISIVSEVGIKDLSGRYNYVILGHYHNPQNIKGGGVEIYYTGSITQNDWGEKNEIKRFLVIDTDSDIIDSIPIEGYKQHFELSITKETKDEVLSRARDLKNQGHEVKFQKSEFFDTDDIEKEFIVVDKTEKDITNRGITSNMTMQEKLERFMDVKNVPLEKREFFKNEGISIISSCGIGD